MIKKFELILCCCFIFAIILAYTRIPDVEFVQVMAVPVSNKVIVVDAGHGTPDERCY